VSGNQRLDVASAQSRLLRVYPHGWIQRRQCQAGGFGLGHADAGIRMQHLALEVRTFDDIVVDQAQMTDSRCGQIERCRRAESACANHCDARRRKPLLPARSDLRQDQMARIALGGISIDRVTINRQPQR